MQLWLEYNALPNVPYYKVFTTLPGTPTTVAPSGISFVTTAPAPIVTLLPILTGPRIVAPVPM